MENPPSKMQKYRRHLLIAGPMLIVLILLIFYLLNRGLVSTDDAYVKAANASINANVSGQVAVIYVHDNQMVKRGDSLFRLDARPYQLAVAHAKAELNNARLNIRALKTAYQAKIAETNQAQEFVTYQQEEFQRQQKMAKAGLASAMQLNKAKNAFNSAKQQLIAKQQQQANILAQLNNNAEIKANQLPSVQAALTNFHQALLNLSYTEIKAPMDGIVAKVESLQLGDYVQAGAPIFALISNSDVWVEANFKETQLSDMRPGQSATLMIDAFPHKKWSGHIVSLSPAVGTSFSLLPAENATGNWVKITQRLPVRISIDDKDHAELASGLSATVTVDTLGSHNEHTEK
ncbi:MAG: HlyD family secretion protein [Pseudomonadota bacterium]